MEADTWENPLSHPLHPKLHRIDFLSAYWFTPRLVWASCLDVIWKLRILDTGLYRPVNYPGQVMCRAGLLPRGWATQYTTVLQSTCQCVPQRIYAE